MSIQKRIHEFQAFSSIIDSIWISDNSNNDETFNVVKELGLTTVLYSRNKFNIGGGANFISSLLMGESEFIWLRGDDDPISEDQVKAVAKAISFNPDIIILSRHSKTYRTIQSFSHFFQSFQECQAAGWLSMLLFKQSCLEYALKWGYWGIYSGWSNITLVYGILRDKPNPFCLLSPVSITPSDFREEGRQSRKWSVIKTCVDDFPVTFNLIENKPVCKLAWYHWRKTHTFNITRTYLRSRLGFAPIERISIVTISNLLAPSVPKSSLIAITLVVIWLIPRTILAIVFSVVFRYMPEQKLEQLDLLFLRGLSCSGIYYSIRTHQLSQSLAFPFL